MSSDLHVNEARKFSAGGQHFFTAVNGRIISNQWVISIVICANLIANKYSRIVGRCSLPWKGEAKPRYRFAPGSEYAAKAEIPPHLTVRMEFLPRGLRDRTCAVKVWRE